MKSLLDSFVLVKRNPILLVPTLIYFVISFFLFLGFSLSIYASSHSLKNPNSFLLTGGTLLFLFFSSYYQAGVYSMVKTTTNKEKPKMKDFFQGGNHFWIFVGIVNVVVALLEGGFQIFDHRFVPNVVWGVLIEIIFSFVAIAIVAEDSSLWGGIKNGVRVFIPGFLQSFLGTLLLAVATVLIGGLLFWINHVVFFLGFVLILFIILVIFPIWMYLIFQKIKKK